MTDSLKIKTPTHWPSLIGGILLGFAAGFLCAHLLAYTESGHTFAKWVSNTLPIGAG